MSEEQIEKIVREVIAAQKPKRHEVALQFIAPTVSALVVSALLYTASIFGKFVDRVERSEKQIIELRNTFDQTCFKTDKRIDDIIDLNMYQSMLIDYNFRVLNSAGVDMHKIYMPDRQFSRSGGSNQLKYVESK